tara:strand:- start:8 stop:631 length:624 start_codon:yes stop_codon:yes gene_type:complete
MKPCWYCDSVTHNLHSCPKIRNGAKELYYSYLNNGLLSNKVKKKWKSYLHNKKNLTAFVLNYKYVVSDYIKCKYPDLINKNNMQDSHPVYTEVFTFINNNCKTYYYETIKNSSLKSLYDITNHIFNNIIIYVLNKLTNLKFEENECPICYEFIPYSSLRELPCRHIFCRSCICKHFERSNTCPMCRRIYTHDQKYIIKLFRHNYINT